MSRVILPARLFDNNFRMHLAKLRIYTYSLLCHLTSILMIKIYIYKRKMNQEYDMFLPFIMSLRVTFVQKTLTYDKHTLYTNKQNYICHNIMIIVMMSN